MSDAVEQYFRGLEKFKREERDRIKRNLAHHRACIEELEQQLSKLRELPDSIEGYYK